MPHHHHLQLLLSFFFSQTFFHSLPQPILPSQTLPNLICQLFYRLCT